MSLLIVAATAFELKPVLNRLKRQGLPLLITGAGMPATLYALTKKLAEQRPALMIQAGIAGCFDRKIPLGATRVIRSDFFGDIGVRQHGQWHTMADLGLADPNQQPFKKGLLPQPSLPLLQSTGVESAAAVTVNTISTNKAMIDLFRKQGVVLESMEGAAFHYVGLQEKIPFLQLRSVSNYIGERNKTKWRLEEATAELGSHLLQVLERLSKAKYF
ncbi:futalosine hydrolase [Niabella terrae]